jgi:DsbC/DsbD-like thiol-disulfide interchange protein
MRNCPLTLFLAAGIIALLGPRAGGTEVKPDPVRAELIAFIDSVRPGTSFTVGVLFTIQPRWHIYWKYSGDAGLPPEIHWQLPDGWSVKDIQWPLPQRFVENGPLTTYGYKDSVLLMAQIIPPLTIKDAALAMINARVNWMVCHDECIPGKTTLSLNLPISIAAPPAASKSIANSRFAKWSKLLPEESSDQAGIIVNVKSRHIDDSGKTAAVTYRIATTHSVGQKIIDWFPAPSQDFAIKKASCKTTGGDTVISFVLHSYAGPIPGGQKLESLLLYKDQSGRRRGIQIMTAIYPS